MNDKKYTLTIDTNKLEKIVKTKKDEMQDLIKEFTLKYAKFKMDREGNSINDTNPYLVSTFFFKSINPMGNVEPIYTSDQLSMVYDLYCYIVEQVNMEIMIFSPTVSHFAKFAGISLNKYNELKNSYDENMKILVEKINADIFDANMTLTQHKKLTEKATTFRMKTENEMLEKKSPNVNVNVSAKTIDLDALNKRITEIKSIAKRQINYEGK